MSPHFRSPDYDAARATFRQYLRNQGIKWTNQREAILETVLNMHYHFEAEELLEVLRRRGHSVGKATVYRTLPLLVACGVLKRVAFDSRRTSYEHALGDDQHDHMICERCGRIIEFAAEDVLALRRVIGERHRFRVTGHRFQLLGLCATCQSEDRGER